MKELFSYISCDWNSLFLDISDFAGEKTACDFCASNQMLWSESVTSWFLLITHWSKRALKILNDLKTLTVLAQFLFIFIMTSASKVFSHLCQQIFIVHMLWVRDHILPYGGSYFHVFLMFLSPQNIYFLSPLRP